MRVWLGGMLLLGLGGCGAPETGGEVDGAVASVCAGETRAVAYAPGLSRSSDDGALVVTLIESDPPPGKGDHRWVLGLTDGAGAPWTGGAPEVRPYMPDHGHGPTVLPEVAAGPEAGTWEAWPVSLFMPGYWEVRITAGDQGVVREVLFPFCVEG